MNRMLALGPTWIGAVWALTAFAAAPGDARQPPARADRGNEATLALPGEPGSPFVIEGVVWGPGDRAPLAHARVYAYHSDSLGRYFVPGGRDSFPRLAGVLVTDAVGRYRVRTVLPGMYEGPPHVHFEIWTQSLPTHATFVSLFMEPGETPMPDWGRMVEFRRIRLRDPRRETWVRRDPLGRFHARHDLHVSASMPLPAEFDSLLRGRPRRR